MHAKMLLPDTYFPEICSSISAFTLKIVKLVNERPSTGFTEYATTEYVGQILGLCTIFGSFFPSRGRVVKKGAA
jgi:hypothetical protein